MMDIYQRRERIIRDEIIYRCIANGTSDNPVCWTDKTFSI